MTGDMGRSSREEIRTATGTPARTHPQVTHQQGGVASSNIEKEATVLQFTTEELGAIRSRQAAASQQNILGQLPGPSPDIQAL